MRKRKQLPDHSEGIPVRHGFFSDEQIEEMQVRYGFRKDFPLSQHLEELAENYLALKDCLSKIPVSEQKELLQELAERTNSLRRAAHRAARNVSKQASFFHHRSPRLFLDHFPLPRCGLVQCLLHILGLLQRAHLILEDVVVRHAAAGGCVSCGFILFAATAQ